MARRGANSARDHTASGGLRASSTPRQGRPSSIKTRIFYRLIKATRHLQNVSREDPPDSIARMTETLTKLIKPATPLQRTSDLIYGNAKNCILILEDHHVQVVEKEISDFLALADSDWEQPFTVASNWAKQHLGRRLQAETVQQAEAQLLARLPEPRSARSTPLLLGVFIYSLTPCSTPTTPEDGNGGSSHQTTSFTLRWHHDGRTP